MPQNVTELFPESSHVFALGHLRFNLTQMLLSDRSGNPVKLRSQTGRVLKHLVQNAGKPVSKAELIEAVWPQKFVTDDSLTQCISELRRKIEDKDHRIIETFPKIGYQLNCDENARFDTIVSDGATRLNLVVRPFEDVSTGAGRGYLGSAITEEVRVGLSRCCDFSLVALPAGGNGHDLSVLAEQHQIHYMLEGSQQKLGNRIRVTARLFDAHSQQNIWAQVYERDLEDFDAGQMEIVELIVVDAGSRMSLGLPSAGVSQNCALYLHLKSRPLARQLDREENLRARDLNLKAIEIEPQSPFGHLGLAVYCHVVCMFNWCEPSQRADILRQGVLYTHRAIELDPNNEAGHRICAYLHLQQGDWEQALERLNASHKLNPYSPLSRTHMSDLLSPTRQSDATLKDIEKGESFYPKPHGWVDSLHCWLLWRNGNYKMTLEKFQSRALVPNFDNLILAASYACLDRLEEARQTAQKYLAEFPEFSLAQEREAAATNFANPKDIERWLNALRAAGVPETARAV